MKLQKLIIFLFVFLSCTSDEVTSIENEVDDNVQTTIESTLEPWSSALGKSPETFVSTWNSIVNSISNDEDTILFFSIDPDEVKWSTFDQEELVYKWGDAAVGDNVFILNLDVENEIVRSVKFFAPTTNDQATTQQTKLFLLLIIAISDDTADKDGREEILAGLGLYDEILDPNDYGGILVFNEIEYEIEPLVAENRLVGLNFYSRYTVK